MSRLVSRYSFLSVYSSVSALILINTCVSEIAKGFRTVIDDVINTVPRTVYVEKQTANLGSRGINARADRIRSKRLRTSADGCSPVVLFASPFFFSFLFLQLFSHITAYTRVRVNVIYIYTQMYRIRIIQYCTYCE